MPKHENWFLVSLIWAFGVFYICPLSKQNMSLWILCIMNKIAFIHWKIIWYAYKGECGMTGCLFWLLYGCTTFRETPNKMQFLVGAMVMNEQWLFFHCGSVKENSIRGWFIWKLISGTYLGQRFWAPPRPGFHQQNISTTTYKKCSRLN